MKSALYAMPEGAMEPANNGNAGLWYDKYCNHWTEKPADPQKNLLSYWTLGDNKQEWIEQVTGRVGNNDLLAEFAQRREQMSERLWQCEPLLFKTEWRFVTGLGQAHPVENGFAWHHALGVPYLPGSSVKGITRAWAEQWSGVDSEELNPIFGPSGTGEVGSVTFLDALPIQSVALETDIMTPHYGPWYGDGETPGDWHDPIPIPFLTVAANQSFQFIVAPRRPHNEGDIANAKAARAWLGEALKWIGAGAKTAVGYGRFKPEGGSQLTAAEEVIWENAKLKHEAGSGVLTASLNGERAQGESDNLKQWAATFKKLSNAKKKALNKGNVTRTVRVRKEGNGFILLEVVEAES